ncbi:MAG: inverse autotransporter beta domain-containing protein [Verrucomicrobiota bacterium]|nr:inverse autotransporter beta domain-containing protein [Verrucomicrobiota bacterium]
MDSHPPFLDARGHVFDNGKWAANAGVGLRTLKGTRAYGINAYYDYRNTGRFHSNQIGAGLESLGELILRVYDSNIRPMD